MNLRDLKPSPLLRPPFGQTLASFPARGDLGAEFLVAAGDLSAFSSADHLAAYAGLVPAARDFDFGK